MNHKERFFATIARQAVDRPCTWLGLPVPEAQHKLFAYFKVADLQGLIRQLDDDIIPVELPYHSPTSNAIYAAFDFAKDRHACADERTLTRPGFFEDETDPACINDFPWPDPYQYIAAGECRKIVADIPGDYPVLGVIWSAHFQDACAAFGMENALIQMCAAPQMFRAVSNRIVEFYLQANEIFYAATRGRLDAVLIGNDLGAQNGLLIAPEAIREFVLPGTRRLVQQAKSYGLKVIHHSCGAVRDIIPDLIQAGVDVIHPIQALAAGMDPYGLKNDFGDQVAFCGGVDAQYLLVKGTAQQVRGKVKELKQLFPSGLIISPSHEAILPDVPPENIAALFESVREK